jgi:O-antigen/teichoic acid export membrane protein
VNFAIKIWIFVITFILFRYIVGIIGETDYGIYLFVTAITGYFGILDLGIGNSLVKFMAEFKAREDHEKMNEMINTSFFMFLFVGIIGGIVILFIGTFVLGFFSGIFPGLDSPEFVPKARAIIYIMGVTFVFNLALSSLRGVLAGLQRYDILALITFIMSLINLTITIIVLTLGYGIVELVLFTTLSGFGGYIFMAYYIRKLLPQVSLSPSFVRRKMIKTLMDLSMSVFLLSIFTMVIYYTDNLVIGLFLDITLITFYQAAWKLYGIPAKVPEIGLAAVIPAASELDAKENINALRRLFLRGTKYILAMCFALSIPLMFLSREILSVWMDSSYSQYYIVVIVLTISLFFVFNNYVANQILIGMNRIKRFVEITGVIAFLNLALSLIFIRMGFGLTGVAMGTTIPFVVLEYFFLKHILTVLDIRWRVYAKSVLLKTFPYAGLVAIMMYALLYIHTPNAISFFWDIIGVGIYFLVGVIAYLLMFYRFGLKEYEKKELRTVLSKIGMRIRPSSQNGH